MLIVMPFIHRPITPVEEYEVTIKKKFDSGRVYHEGIIFHQLTGKHVPTLSAKEKNHVYMGSKMFQWDAKSE